MIEDANPLISVMKEQTSTSASGIATHCEPTNMKPFLKLKIFRSVQIKNQEDYLYIEHFGMEVVSIYIS